MVSSAPAIVAFEHFIRMTLRRGYLDLEAALEHYRRLRPDAHPHLHHPQVVDVQALRQALAALPPGFVEAPEVLVVKRLDDFAPQEILQGGDFRAGVLSDGTLILACPRPEEDVAHLVALLCLIDTAQEKALGLIPAQLLQSEADPSGDGPSDADIAHLSTAWGTTPQALFDGAQATNGLLLRWLLGRSEIPPVRLHPNLDASLHHEDERRLAQSVVGAIAEMGLIHRPAILWFGAQSPMDCLSPYTRDNRDVLLQWAKEQGLVPQPADENSVYAIARELLDAHPDAAAEKTEVERRLGINHINLAGGFDIIDLGRIVPDAIDTRAQPWQCAEPKPVLLRFPLNIENHGEVFLSTLLTQLAGQLRDIVVAAPICAAQSPKTLVFPKLLVGLEPFARFSLPTQNNLLARAEDTLRSYYDGTVQEAPVLWSPGYRLVDHHTLEALQARYGLAGILGDGALILRQIAECFWTGTLKTCPLTVTLVDPKDPSQSAQHALALALIHSLGQRQAPQPEPERPSMERAAETTPEKPIPSRRAIRIRA